MTDAEIQKINYYAERLLDMPGFEESENPELLLKTEVALVNDFANACRKKDYSIYTKPVSGALKKARKDILCHKEKFQKLIDKAQTEIEKLDIQENQIRNYNQSVINKTYDLKQERAKLGFFDGIRKKEIEAELSKWKRKDIPPELDEKRKKLQEIIKEYKDYLEPWLDKVREITFYEGEVEAYIQTQEREQNRSPKRNLQEENTIKQKKSVRETLEEKQELVKTPQEPREATKETFTLKPLKEVHIPDYLKLKKL